MTMVRVQGDQLILGELTITFQRTLRIPDDGRTYPLPPGLGAFPLRRVDDYSDRVPSEWLEHGSVFLPMYQREAMWLSFSRTFWKPCALKVGIGKVCALTGERWSEELHEARRGREQDYLVTPPQPWLDGICVSKGKIRQFVAMPLGMGYTVEAQVTGEEHFGGIQLKMFEPKPGRFHEPPPYRGSTRARSCPPPMACAAPAPAPGAAPFAAQMGLGAGGRMEQKIYPDPHGIDTWDYGNTARVFVHIVNSEMWREITGERPPETPVSAREYRRHNLPWFELYDEHLPALDGSKKLREIKSVRDLDEEKSTRPLQDDSSVAPGIVKKLWMSLNGGVRDGKW